MELVMTGSIKYQAVAESSDGTQYDKLGTMAEITAWLNGFVTVEIRSVTIGKLIAEITPDGKFRSN